MLGRIMIDVEGTELLPIEKYKLQHPNTGGVLLFARNYVNKQQIKELVKSIRSVSGRDLIIAVDHEGGRVWRFENGFTKFPEMKTLGKLYETNSKLALNNAKKAGKIIAKELLEVGIDLTFAPVLDLDYEKSKVIAGRSFHNDPNIVINLASNFIEGLNSEGMKAIGKHFPGHGACEPDTHLESAIDNRNFNKILQMDLLPYVKLKNELTGILVSHVIYPLIDDLPACFSKVWIKDILRKDLNFRQAIISDCLSMQAAATKFPSLVKRVQSSLDAGCDMVILTQQNQKDILSVLDNINCISDKKIISRLNILRSNKCQMYIY